MTQHLRYLVIYALVFLPNTAAMGGVFTYDITSMDADLGLEACNSVMSDAAGKFATDSGVKLINSGCEADNLLGRLTGKIVYSASQRVSPWSTTSTTYGEETEFYQSRQQCEEALALEVQLLKNMSSLTPFISFCHKISEIGPPRYRTRIDAIGETNVRRYESVAVTNYTPHNLNAVVQNLQAQAEALGLTTVAWYFGPIRSQRSLSVAYYSERAESPFRLLAKNSLYFSTLPECEAAIVAFDQTRTTAWTGVPSCTVAPEKVGFQLNLNWWDRAIGADLVLRSTLIPGIHANLIACRSAAAELAAQLGQDGEKIVGIVCGRDSNPQSPIKMELIGIWGHPTKLKSAIPG